MKLNDSIIFQQELVRDICHCCNNFEANDYFTAPHIDIKYYSCKCGGCIELAKCYSREEYLCSFQNEIINKFL